MSADAAEKDAGEFVRLETAEKYLARALAAEKALASVERCRRLHGLDPGYVMGCDECERA